QLDSAELLEGVSAAQREALRATAVENLRSFEDAAAVELDAARVDPADSRPQQHGRPELLSRDVVEALRRDAGVGFVDDADAVREGDLVRRPACDDERLEQRGRFG